jgi:hypothetical protein
MACPDAARPSVYEHLRGVQHGVGAGWRQVFWEWLDRFLLMALVLATVVWTLAFIF